MPHASSLGLPSWLSERPQGGGSERSNRKALSVQGGRTGPCEHRRAAPPGAAPDQDDRLPPWRGQRTSGWLKKGRGVAPVRQRSGATNTRRRRWASKARGGLELSMKRPICSWKSAPDRQIPTLT